MRSHDSPYRSDSLLALCNHNIVYVWHIIFAPTCILMRVCVCVCWACQHTKQTGSVQTPPFPNRKTWSSQEKKKKRQNSSLSCCRTQEKHPTATVYLIKSKLGNWLIALIDKKNSLFNKMWRETRRKIRIWKFPLGLDQHNFSPIDFSATGECWCFSC